ncbi:hypothetical protein [Methylobacterium aquaticum]|uniref:hypothetical protein n=1 Tax=Methylobacterium aquaticum TaxID=270351 RepID=UPI000AF221C2|nr:hypothetical protein [Methylobacterium aquaticum]
MGIVSGAAFKILLRYCGFARFIFLFYFFIGSFDVFAQVVCADPPSQVASEVSVEAKASAQTIARLGAGSITVSAQKAAKNLYEKYPDVKEIIIAQLMMSNLCNFLKEARQLNDKEKIEIIMNLNKMLLMKQNQKFNEDLKIQKNVPKQPKQNDVSHSSGEYLQFADTSGQNNVVFYNKGGAIYNVRHKRESHVVLNISCARKSIFRILIPRHGVSSLGYSRPSRKIVIFEGPYLALINNWILRAHKFLKEEFDETCKMNSYVNSFYVFEFLQADGSEVSLYYNGVANVNIAQDLVMNLGEANLAAYIENESERRRASKLYIDFENTQDEYVKNEVKNIIDWKCVLFIFCG